MKTKIIGILVVTLLIAAVVLPVAGATNVGENEDLPSGIWVRVGFFRGKVENITEEIHNGSLFYNCTAVDVRITWLIYEFPLSFDIENVRLVNTDFFIIRDSSFVGILREGLIFGIVYSAGWT